jgi:hypothetical protein
MTTHGAAPTPKGFLIAGWLYKAPGINATHKASNVLPQTAIHTTTRQYLAGIQPAGNSGDDPVTLRDGKVPVGKSRSNSTVVKSATGSPIHEETHAIKTPPGSDPGRASV